MADAVDTVVCAHDDGWKYHPKHVEQFPNINKLCNVASCWTYIGILLAHPILHISRILVNDRTLGRSYSEVLLFRQISYFEITFHRSLYLYSQKGPIILETESLLWKCKSQVTYRHSSVLCCCAHIYSRQPRINFQQGRRFFSCFLSETLLVLSLCSSHCNIPPDTLICQSYLLP
jgi:hypothetical protein